MKQQEVFKKIGTILKELNDQYEYLDKNEDQQNDLELELFVANAHFLADHSEVLRKLNQQKAIAPVKEEPAKEEPVKEKPVKEPEERYFEPLVQVKPPEEEPPAEIEATHSIEEPPPHIDLGSHGADDDFSFVRKDPEIIKHELVLDESEVWEDEDDQGFEIEEAAKEKPVDTAPAKKDKPVPEIQPAEVKKDVPRVTYPKKEPVAAEGKTEAATEEPLTINQMISSQMNKTGRAAEHLHTQPITDLKQAINLNDKLLYIKDLFNGYNLAYSEAVDILNRFSSFSEAEDFLKTNYAVKNHWDAKEATADKFYELLRRRFA